MPITLTLSAEALPHGAEAVAVKRITDAFLAAHGLAGHPVMTPNTTTHLTILPQGASFAGGVPVVGAWVETKTPSFALADRSAQVAFFSAATAILVSLSEGRLTPDRVWSNAVHAVDGSWNLDGAPRTNAELGAALSAA